MRLALDPFRLLLISLAGCLGQQQREVIDYLQEENRVLASNSAARGCASMTSNVRVVEGLPDGRNQFNAESSARLSFPVGCGTRELPEVDAVCPAI